MLLLLALACRTKDLGVDTGLPDDDGDGIPATEDCDDANPDVGLPTAWYADGDGDGYGYGVETWRCEAPSGTVDNADDCDDNDPAIHPGAPEEDCTDPVDYNCDGSVGYADADGDGYAACEECDDSERAINPSATEVCDELDNDCDGEADNDAVDADTFYADVDADGFGDAGTPVLACEVPEGAVEDDEDCDDTNPDVNPSADEVCNGLDDDCDGDIDADAVDAPTWYVDADSDGYGNPSFTTTDCAQPSGTVDNADDCDDTEASAWTGNTESCDEADNDCDGSVDEGVTTTFYGDGDQDGYGDDSVTTEACSAPAYYSDLGGDCNDNNANVNPGATPGCDGNDYDCDGSIDNDTDGDGYADASCGGDDCDDGDASVSPSEAEVCDDGLDNDCDGTSNSCGWDGESSVTDADLIVTGDNSYDYLGGYGTGGGDFNGDGYDDVVLGAQGDDNNGSASGSVFVFEGPVTGSLSAGDADYTLEGDSGDRFGRSVAVGNVNGDSYDDLLVVATHDGTGGAYAGAAWLYHGPLTDGGTGDAVAIFVGENASDWVGDVNAADLDGDGDDDFLIAAQGNDAGGSNAGAVYIVSGTTTGTLDLSNAPTKLVGEAAGDEAGSAIGSAGDTDGDGNIDVLVGARYNDNGATDAGTVYLLLGPQTGTVDLSSSDTMLQAKHASDYVGGDTSVTGAGDLNGDGYDDVVVGAGGDDDNGTNAGAVYLYFGPLSSGAQSVLNYDHKVKGESPGDGAGRSIVSAGDVDGDGTPDLWLSSVFEDTGGTNAGATYLVLGPATGISDLEDAKAKFTGTGASDYLGNHNLAAPGDVNGDGYADVLAASQLNDTAATDAGAAYLFLGGGL